MNPELVYPSIGEILPAELQARVPESLAKLIRDRYAELGPKYMTEMEFEDGRRINSCMFKSSIQDATEEVVDAVFNVLVWMFKLRVSGRAPGASYSALMGLIELFALFQSEASNDPL